jgi:DNA-binding LytR/AlgR family response regulator
MIKCLIIDDEPLAIEVLENHIRNIEFVKVESTFSNAVEAYQYLLKNKIDLIFLDISMPRLSGLDFLKTLKNPPHVIITTAYREFALDGYELDVKDFLLKPVSFERFLMAVAKVSAKGNDVNITTLPVLQKGTDYMFVKSNKKMIKVFFDDILYIESIRDYIKIKTDKIEVVSPQSISSFYEQLPKPNFLRIHKSFIINVDRINSYTNNSVEINNKEFPLGRLYKNEALKALMKS